MAKPPSLHACNTEASRAGRPDSEPFGASHGATDRSPWDAVLAGPVRKRNRGELREADVDRITGVVLGRIVKCSAGNGLCVAYGSHQDAVAVPAKTMVSVSPADVDREVALLFEEADPTKPIIMGFMQHSSTPAIGVETTGGLSSVSVHLTEDGKRLTLSAQDEITLRCGDASVTLTRAGKILLKGKFLSSHSSGVNRIRGGSVQLN